MAPNIAKYEERLPTAYLYPPYATGEPLQRWYKEEHPGLVRVGWPQQPEAAHNDVETGRDSEVASSRHTLARAARDIGGHSVEDGSDHHDVAHHSYSQCTHHKRLNVKYRISKRLMKNKNVTVFQLKNSIGPNL